ncbi:MAG TPA: FMN-binding glutamate synthase family protein [Coxiellaceae bacterium]|nr:FMN-binding glutamate synthase family protein [Coxiellaceae bacterium]
MFAIGILLCIHLHHGFFFTGVLGLLVLVGLYDHFISSSNILRLYPISGHLRHIFESIRPEIQQYFVESNSNGQPYERELRSLVYQRSKNAVDTRPFGTERNIKEQNFTFTQHSLHVVKPSKEADHVVFGNEQCQQPYKASVINISAMSYGALSSKAIRTLNRGAKLAGMAHNTGEGGLSSHHLKEGGDLIWQLGTAYFGTRDKEGFFDSNTFKKKSQLDAVKMIEIKLSQGAKPSHGGVLPAAKISREIAEIRGVKQGEDCISPPTHTAFSTPIEMMHFVQHLRELSNGKPIGFKLCLGYRRQFMSICKAMLETQIYPDFITVDGAEGGTGAAPVEYTNYLGIPGDEAIAFVHNALVGLNIRKHIKIISSAKITSGFDIIRRKALGADTCNLARPMLFAIGCVQSVACNTNKCPTGIATNKRSRAYAIKLKKKSQYVANFHNNTINSYREMMGAMGIKHPDELNAHLIQIRLPDGRSTTCEKFYHYLEAGNLLSDNIHPFYQEFWEKARTDSFA